MAVFSGKGASALDLVAKHGVTKKEIEIIYDEVCPACVGELKFVSGFENLAGKGLSKQSGVWKWNGTTDFDGWVYPDGSSFSASDFPEAATEYGSSGGSFSVPNLQDSFFKGASTAMSDVAQKSGLQRHNHPLTNDAGIPAQLSLKNGFVFCAAGNYGSTRVQTYYTHPATIDASGKAIKGNKVGTMRPMNPADPNLSNKPPETPIEKWSLEYTVPAFHSGRVDYTSAKGSKGTYLPIPFDMTLKLSDVAAWFEGGSSRGPLQNASYPYAVDSGHFVPESVNVPVMIYIGKKLV